MTADFTTLVTRLDSVRQALVATLRTKGVDAAADDSLTVLIGKVSLVDSTSGMNQILACGQHERHEPDPQRIPTLPQQYDDGRIPGIRYGIV